MRREEFIRIRAETRRQDLCIESRVIVVVRWKLNERSLEEHRAGEKEEKKEEEEEEEEGRKGKKIETCQVPDRTRESFPREFTGTAEAKSRRKRDRRVDSGIAGNAKACRRSPLRTLKITNNVEKYFTVAR